MKYLFNSIRELREFVKNDFENSNKILLVEKDNKIIVELNDKQIATIPYGVYVYNKQSMYIIDPNEIETLKFIFDKSITFNEIATNKNTKEINIETNMFNFKYISFKYKNTHVIEIKPAGMYEINIDAKIPTTANHFTKIFEAIDKAIEKIK